MGSPCKTSQRCRPSAWCLSWRQPALQQTCLGSSTGPSNGPQGSQGHPWICSSSTSISPGAKLRSRQGTSWSRIYFCQNRPQGKLQVGRSSPCRSPIWPPVVFYRNIYCSQILYFFHLFYRNI